VLEVVVVLEIFVVVDEVMAVIVVFVLEKFVVEDDEVLVVVAAAEEVEVCSIVGERIDKIANSTARPASTAIAATLAPTLALPAGLSAMAMAAAAFDRSMVIVILVSSWTERLDVRLKNV